MADEPIIHLPGEFTPEQGQHCVRCGEQLSAPLADLAWPEGEKPPSGWAAGKELFHEDNWWASLEIMENPEQYGEELRCKVED